MTVVPEVGPEGNCTTTGCGVDLNAGCPSELKVTASDEGVACKAPVRRLGTHSTVVVGALRDSGDTCKPSSYSQFLRMCPKALQLCFMMTAPAPSLAPPPIISSLSALPFHQVAISSDIPLNWFSKIDLMIRLSRDTLSRYLKTRIIPPLDVTVIIAGKPYFANVL
ncbi:hypothetical protein GBA52_025697 [Prunus armeniaca]|nr:hypothetical protein GBA52_025697 [Prunus armeniaca]